jgi:1-acyl-sn-glycerol-3-phosphate acyltransferase
VTALAAFLVAFAPPRLIAIRCGSAFGRLSSQRFHRLLCACLGVRVRVHGRLDPKARLIAPNHVSWLDIPILGSLAPMSFLAKKEIGSHPVGRELVAMQGAVYVDRGRRFKIPAVNVEMARTMQAGSPVVLFAEATTGDGNRLLPFRSSHFEAVRLLAKAGRTLALIQPVFLAYSRLSGLPVSRADRPRIAWYGDMAFLTHLFGLIDRGALTCDVYFGDPIPATPEMPRKIVARQTEEAVRRLGSAAKRPRD